MIPISLFRLETPDPCTVDEITIIEKWTTDNNLTLDCAKSREIVFTARGKSVQQPQPCPNIERVTSHRVFGVTVNNMMTADQVSYLVYD